MECHMICHLPSVPCQTYQLLEMEDVTKHTRHCSTGTWPFKDPWQSCNSLLHSSGTSSKVILGLHFKDGMISLGQKHNSSAATLKHVLFYFISYTNGKGCGRDYEWDQSSQPIFHESLCSWGPCSPPRDTPSVLAFCGTHVHKIGTDIELKTAKPSNVGLGSSITPVAAFNNLSTHSLILCEGYF